MRVFVPILVASLLPACSGDGEDGLTPTRRRFEGTVTFLSVDTSEGSVTLIGRDTRVVEATFTPSREGDNFQANLALGELTLGSVCQDGSRGCGTHIEATVPRDVEFAIVTDRGDVTIRDLTFAGDIQSRSGNVLGEDLGLRTLTTETLDADQDLHFATTTIDDSMDVHMETGGSGALTIRLPPGGYRFDAKTNGPITFESGEVRDSDGGPHVTMLANSGPIVITSNL